ncbi:MAG: hypothetical protein ACE5DO_04380 [Desulfobacterales bacterium]
MENFNNNAETPSLLPYLEETGAKLRLKFSLIDSSVSFPGTSSFPFLIISESDSLAQLIEGQIETDGGSVIKRIFAMVQRDEYHLSRDECLSYNNLNIEYYWQRAFSNYSKNIHDGSVVILGDQIRKDGSFAPFRSLFHCKLQRIFFIPPCPKCGIELHQCCNDELLKSIGLPAYSTSLDRYLFCPACYKSSGTSDYYAYILKRNDPPLLKDHRDLIKAFGQMVLDGVQPAQFPCPNCPDQPECFGTTNLALSRIMPFSFYPFYMLLLDGDSINAIEFLSLLSGATLKDLEKKLIENQEVGRKNCLKKLKKKYSSVSTYLFNRDNRFCLEILYLKLSFLGELADQVFSFREINKNQNNGLPIEKIWVKISDPGDLLPTLWNFKLRMIDLGQGSNKAPNFSSMCNSSDAHLFGLSWFYVLLVNKKQSIEDVYAALDQAIKQQASNTAGGFESLTSNKDNSAFSHGNIFWDPDGGEITQHFKTLWEKSLDLGWSLLMTGLKGDINWSEGLFRKKLENLREEVRNTMFQREPTDKPSPHRVEDQAISRILRNIKKEWSTGPLPEPSPENADVDKLKKTFTINQERKLDETTIVKTKVEGKGKDDFLAETIILKPDEDGKSNLDQTTVIKPKVDISGNDDFFPGSFDLGLDKSGDQNPDETTIINKTGKKSIKNNMLAETVVIRSNKESEID